MPNRFQSTFKVREDIQGNLTPQTIINRRIDAPAGEWLPADWLPVAFKKSDIAQGENAFVISSGKPVAFDSTGKIVPAGLRTAMGSSTYAATALSYTADDVTYKTVDLVTGEYVTAAVNYTGEQVADALIERGFVREADATAAGATVPVAANADVEKVINLFISTPIGIITSDVYSWSGLPWKGDQKFTNFSLQHQIQFLTEAQMIVPLRVAGSETSDTFDVSVLDAAPTSYAAGSGIAAGEFWEIADIRQLTRYGALGASAPVVALGLAQTWVASNTTRTPFTCDIDTVLVRERTSAADVKVEGDWFLDGEVGVLFLHADTWATLVAGDDDPTFSYNFYTDTGTAGAHRYVHCDGPVRPGDYLVVDAKSNFTKASAAQIAACEAIARVLEVRTEPYALLDKVKTAWKGSEFSSASKMPGSATGGYTDLITLSGEDVADKVVVINVRI